MPAETATVDPAPEGEPGLGNPRDDVEHHRATTGAPMHRRLSVVAVVVLIAAALLAAGYVMSRPRSQGTPSESATVRPLSPSASASSVAESPAATPASGASTSVRPHIVSNFIPFDSKRRKQMATYLGERYGDSSLVLDPRVIVLLNTATDTAAAAHKRFAAETIGRPGVVAHFIVDKDGTIYQDLATDLRGVHTVGLNHVAIGIAFVQSERGGPAWVDHQVLTRQRQLLSGLKLTAWLQQEYRIGDRDVIGHAMAPDSPFYKDYAHIESEKTDWPARDVAVFRQALRAMSGN